MNPKERILAALSGKETDRLPWSPFLAYWWEAQSQEFQAMGQLKFMEDIGADPLLRGFHTLFEKRLKNCEIITKEDGRIRHVIHETSVGSLFSTFTYAPQGNTWFLTEHPIKTREDLKILQYMYENMSLYPKMDGFINDWRETGSRGLHVPLIGAEGKTSFQSMVEHWVGTEELVYMIEDYPEVVDECLAIMMEKSVQTAVLSVDSPAEAFIFWEDSSTTNISPAYFKKYTEPEIREWAKVIHSAHKKLIHHACGHIRDLLPLMADTGVDCIESISPPPTGNVEIWDAFGVLPENIALIGGIEPTVFLNSTNEELCNYVETLLDKTADRRFVLANSDSCPPGVADEKFQMVTELVRNRNKE